MGVFSVNGKWTPGLSVAGRQYYLGSRETPEEAARIYDWALGVMVGQPPINFPDEPPLPYLEPELLKDLLERIRRTNVRFDERERQQR